MTKPKLTAKQQRFVEEYLVDLNATQAAIRAGYSEKTAQVIGAENLSKPMLAQAIDKERAKLSEKTQIDQAWVLKRLARIAEVDLVGKKHHSVKASDVTNALNQIGKHFGMFTDRLEVLTPDSELTEAQLIDELEKTRSERRAAEARASVGEGTASEGES